MPEYPDDGYPPPANDDYEARRHAERYSETWVAHPEEQAPYQADLPLIEGVTDQPTVTVTTPQPVVAGGTPPPRTFAPEVDTLVYDRDGRVVLRRRVAEVAQALQGRGAWWTPGVGTDKLEHIQSVGAVVLWHRSASVEQALGRLQRTGAVTYMVDGERFLVVPLGASVPLDRAVAIREVLAQVTGLTPVGFGQAVPAPTEDWYTWPEDYTGSSWLALPPASVSGDPYCPPVPPVIDVPGYVNEPESLSFDDLFTSGALDQAEHQQLLDIGTLPGWPGAPPTGHGLGEGLTIALGGGIAPGSMTGIAAPKAAAGKTALALQIVGGLALRTALTVLSRDGGPITPVVIVSEMTTRDLFVRHVARLAGVNSRLLRSGPAGALLLAREHGMSEADAARMVSSEFQRARDLLRAGIWGWSSRFTRVVPFVGDGKQFLWMLEQRVGKWREQLLRLGYPDVWPVVLVDPLQRFAGDGSEIDAVGSVVKGLHALTRKHDWVTILTSDTTKSSASNAGKPMDFVDEGTAAYRGTYQIQHLLDTALYMRPAEAAGVIEVGPVKNRWGASGSPQKLAWDPATGRFTPLLPAAPLPSPTGLPPNIQSILTGAR